MERLLITTLKYPDYIRRIKVSEKRRTLYYEKGGKKDSPKYAKPPKYIWKKKNGKERLFNTEKDEFVIRNSRTAGKPRYKNINSQYLYNQKMHQHQRAKMMDAIKDFFRPALEDIPPIELFPIILEGEIYDLVDDPISGNRWDMENRQGMYVKAFHDLLHEMEIIPDDNVLYITKPLCFIFTPGSPKMVIHIYHDLRKEVQWNQ